MLHNTHFVFLAVSISGPVTQQPAPATPAAVPATPAVPAEEPATAEEPAEPVAVTIVVQGPQPPTTPSSPSNPPPTSPQQSKYCIPATRGMQFNLLAAGDSITQGSVPSKNYNHPYTIKLKELLRKKLGKNADCTDAGAPEANIMLGCFCATDQQLVSGAFSCVW